MEMTARNPHSALCLALMHLSEHGTKVDGNFVLSEPCAFTWEQPKERFVFWEGMSRDPGEELRQVAIGLAAAEAHIGPAGETVLQGSNQFLFSTPLLAVQGRIVDNKLNMMAITTQTNPFIGAFGQINMQLTMLHELMAKSIRKSVGQFTIQHMGLSAPMEAVGALLEASRKQHGEDPYTEKLVKPRDLDANIELQMLATEGAGAIGYKSKWVRHVALPLLEISEMAKERPLAALQQVNRIKASDWRASMEEWLEVCCVRNV